MCDARQAHCILCSNRFGCSPTYDSKTAQVPESTPAGSSLHLLAVSAPGLGRVCIEASPTALHAGFAVPSLVDQWFGWVGDGGVEVDRCRGRGHFRHDGVEVAIVRRCSESSVSDRISC